MTIKDFDRKFSDLLNEAAKAQLSLGAIVATIEIAKIEMITEQIATTRMRVMTAMAAQREIEAQATASKIITPN